MSAGGRLILITGPIGAGKTAFCLAAVDWARTLGWKVAGLVSPPVFESKVKVGIDVVDVRSGERRRLARLRLDSTGAIATEHWTFYEDVLRWGNQVLGDVLPSDLLVVDELGPLEFERGQGWLAGLTALDSRLYRLGLASIRPELLDLARRRWPDAEVEYVSNAGSGMERIACLFDRLANNSTPRHQTG